MIETSSETADTILVTFEDPSGGVAQCANMVAWGIDMVDPMPVDTPQGDLRFIPVSGPGANVPSPPMFALGGNHSPPQAPIEFDPPISSAEFYYSREKGAATVWNGVRVFADSMPVYALSRTPGTLDYQQWDQKTLYGNVQRGADGGIVFSAWTKVKLQSSFGNTIQWLWFDGTVAIDNLRVTRDRDVIPPCPPTGDSILNDSTVRQQYLQQLARSRPNANGIGKKEYGGYVYQKDDGTYFLQPANDLTATDCGFNIPAGSPPTIPGAHYANAFWHTHPSYAGERLYGCSWAKPGDIVTADRSPKHGGGSPQDWQAVDDAFTPGYIIDIDKNVYRLDPGTPRSQRGNNPNHWKFDSANRCLSRVV